MISSQIAIDTALGQSEVEGQTSTATTTINNLNISDEFKNEFINEGNATKQLSGMTEEIGVNEMQQESSLMRRAKKLIDNQYESFADERQGCAAKFFINGKAYFEDLFDTLMNAKKNIFIMGFGVSPELFLFRPVAEKINYETRLMDIFSIKAKENVMIKILIYHEVPYTVPLESAYTKKLLNSLHPNIKVRRFPRNKFPFENWANHEKVVIVDGEIAYVGGIDLFWGRWDDENFDIKEESNSEHLYKWPGIDYSNDRFKDRTDLKHYLKEYINRDETPRMPWHDVTSRIEGPVVIDTTRHFLQRWYFAIEGKITVPISFGNFILK